MELNGMSTKAHDEKLYSNLLYQIIHNLHLADDKATMNELISYLKEIFLYDDDRHAGALKKVQALSQPTRKTAITIIKAVDLTVDPPPLSGKNQFFVTVEFETAKGVSAATTVKEDLIWNESIHLPLKGSHLDDSLVVRIWNNLPVETLSKKVMGILHAGKSKLMGKTIIPLKAIKPSKPFAWSIVDKRNPDNRKSLINLKVVYTMENLPFDSIEEYTALLETLLRYELMESGVSQYWWDGHFTKAGESLLTYYRADKDLPHAAIQLAQWTVYCKVQADYPLAYALFDTVLEQMEPFILREKFYNNEQLTEFWHTTTAMLEYTMLNLEQYKFDNEKRAMNMMKVLNRISRIVSMTKLGLSVNDFLNGVPLRSGFDKKARNSIEALVYDALKENATAWFRDEMARVAVDEGDNLDTQRIKMVSVLTDGIKARLIHLTAKYQSIFKKQFNIELVNLYAGSLIDAFIPWACQKVSAVCQCLETSQIDLAKQLKQLYFNIKSLGEYGVLSTTMNTKEHQRKLLLTNNYQTWFNEALPKWFDILLVHSKEKIVKAFELNQNVPDANAKYTTSVGDTFDILYCFVVEWKLLGWTNNSSVERPTQMVYQKILNGIQLYITQTLSDTKINSEPAKTEDIKITIKKLSTAMNNIEFLMGKLSYFVDGLSNNEAIHALLTTDTETFKGTVQNDVHRLLVLPFVQHKFIVHFGKMLKEALNNPKADPVYLAYLDTIMQTFNDTLTDTNFKVIYDATWTAVVTMFHAIVDGYSSLPYSEISYANLSQVFVDLCEVFNAAETNEMEKIATIKAQLRLYGCPCEELIHAYYAELYAGYHHNEAVEEKSYGVLTVSGAFTETGIKVSVLNGRNLQPHPSKMGKKPDTYVEVQFVFNKAGSHIKSLKTKTQGKNDFPLYDETFTIPLSTELHGLDDTVIVFTLWDPDMFGVVQNYLSECYLTFKEIKESKGKQIHLALVKPPSTAGYECVNGIRARTDKYSKEFIRVFKIRIGMDNLLDATLNLNKNLSRSMKHLLLN